MGLFEFMSPPASDTTDLGFEHPGSGGYEVALRASVDGHVVATTRVRRQTPDEVGVASQQLTVPADGVHGTVFQPKDTTAKRPAGAYLGR